MKIFNWVVGLFLVLSIIACGGGGGSSGTKPGDPDLVVVPAVSDVVFELDKTSIFNSGGDAAELKVSVLDASRNVVAGVPVEVSLSPDGVFLKTSGEVTDSNGQFVGRIQIGGNKSNRVINATISVKELKRTASVQVTGSQISVTPVPAVPTTGQSVSLTIAASDSAGVAIPNVNFSLAGTAGASGEGVTDVSGNKDVAFNVPNVAGTYTVIVNALGTSVTKTIEVVAAGAGGKPHATGIVSASSLTPTPTTIQPNAVGSTTNRSKLKAKFQTAENKGIENMRVQFVIMPPDLGNNETISTGYSIVYTDSSGVAESDYISGTRSSPTNGVKVRACFSKTDLILSEDSCRNESDSSKYVDASLTVAGAPLSISIGDGNLLEKGLGEIAYVKKFLIQVNDSAGVAVKDAIVSASVDITHYGKGVAWNNPYYLTSIPNNWYIHEDYEPIPLPVDRSMILKNLQSSTYIPPESLKIWCLNEDWNRNGFLDAGEDVNKDGSIQPKKAEIIVSYVNGNKTDRNGQLLVQLSYGQNMGGWLAYTLRATTGVEGSEGDAAKSYVTDVLEEDVKNGSFLKSPFGFSSCRSSN